MPSPAASLLAAPARLPGSKGRIVARRMVAVAAGLALSLAVVALATVHDAPVARGVSHAEGGAVCLAQVMHVASAGPSDHPLVMKLTGVPKPQGTKKTLQDASTLQQARECSVNARWVYALLSPAVSNDIPARLAGNVGECSLPSIQKMAGQVAGLGTGDGVTAGLGTLAAAIGNAAHSVYAVQLSADGGANHYFVLQQDGPTLRLIQSWSNSNGEWPGYSVANWLTPVAQDPEVVADPQTVLQHTRNIEHARYTAGGDAFRPAADVLGLLEQVMDGAEDASVSMFGRVGFAPTKMFWISNAGWTGDTCETNAADIIAQLNPSKA